MNTPLTQLNDLTTIKGIGPTRQAWLRAHFPVQTCGDLAALTPDEIEAKLKAEKQIVSRTEIESWIAQAQALVTAATRREIESQIAAQLQPAAPFPMPAAATASLDGRKVAAAPSCEASSEWQAIARFVVEFQTHLPAAPDGAAPRYRTIANHLDLMTDQLLHRQSWPGLERDLLCTWLLAQIEQSQLPTAVAPPAPPSAKPTAPASLPIKITQIQLFQPPAAPIPSAVSNNVAQPQAIVVEDRPFALEVTFVLHWPALAAAGTTSGYSAQFHLRELLTGRTINLGETATYPVATDQTVYTAKLPVGKVATGLYRLQVVVILQSSPRTLGYFELPLLQIL